SWEGLLRSFHNRRLHFIFQWLIFFVLYSAMTQSRRDWVGGWSTLMVGGSLSRRAGYLLRYAGAVVLPVAAAFSFAAAAEPASSARGAAPSLKIAVTVSVTGPGSTVGVPVLDAARLAVEEASADGGVSRLEL